MVRVKVWFLIKKQTYLVGGRVLLGSGGGGSGFGLLDDGSLGGRGSGGGGDGLGARRHVDVVVVWLLAVAVEGVDAVEIHRESVLQMVGMWVKG